MFTRLGRTPSSATCTTEYQALPQRLQHPQKGWQMHEIKINPGPLGAPDDWQERDDCMEVVEAMAGPLDDEVAGVLMDYCAKVADDAHTNKEPE